MKIIILGVLLSASTAYANQVGPRDCNQPLTRPICVLAIDDHGHRSQACFSVNNCQWDGREKISFGDDNTWATGGGEMATGGDSN